MTEIGSRSFRVPWRLGDIIGDMRINRVTVLVDLVWCRSSFSRSVQILLSSQLLFRDLAAILDGGCLRQLRVSVFQSWSQSAYQDLSSSSWASLYLGV